MADQDLRELLRRWQASRSAMDEAAWLAARLRAGELAPERLLLCARIGSTGARRLLGAEAPRPERDVERWLEGLLQDAPELALRAAIAALRRVVPAWEHQPERCERHGALQCRAAPCQPDPRVRRVLLPLEATAVRGVADHELLVVARGCVAAREDLEAGRGSQSVHIAGHRRDAGGEAEYHEATWKVHAARAGLLAAGAGLVLHGTTEERIEARALITPRAPLHLPDFPAPLAPEHPEWTRYAGALGTLMATRAAVEGLPTLRALAREQAQTRRVDPGYAVQEALEEVRDGVRRELLPWFLGVEDPLAGVLARRP